MFKRTRLHKTLILITVFLVIGFTFAGIGCVDKEGTTAKEGIIVKGSDTVLPLSQAEAEEFMLKHADKSITVIGGGS
ncbi:MAG: phosphate ABC transporter substrate-binding protein, partial [Methanomethylovorans sp.]|nr:phosphate ABC transporter substrate-binding protein [Methanomethylovorans sp.]